MGILHKWWQVTWLIINVSFLFLSSSFVRGSIITDSLESLDDLLCKQAVNDVKGKFIKTAIVYEISIPSNLTGMKISAVRLRAVSFWNRGLNHSFLSLPPKVVAQPSMKRIAILYENLGKWSNLYFNVSNYTMIAPILGFIAYSSSEKELLDCQKIKIDTQGGNITIRFRNVSSHPKNVTPLCAKIGDNGTVEFSNMTKPYFCEAQSQGHYTLVIPSSSAKESSKLWWVLGFVIGLVVLILLALILVAIKIIKKRKIKEMEKVSEVEEAFDTFWIGDTKLPSASMIRTQPSLENEYHYRGGN
ncbi:hypothetical protein HN51_046268 [Arachis hypogaea]|uniref:uncharacterized protein LOC107622895 n=1 Tax=Arachis ipaensis TaxID=130454 RepID=UPI0007AF5613|nr:uncharacterized protein LOC107622895 [Arachis ipaensis]XP_025631581.1 uncharacterized protein LOC112726416 [Arachis hypogaea]QHO22386.1 uncharacterized protein DS421_12g354810 [Arachis hypogaea]